MPASLIVYCNVCHSVFRFIRIFTCGKRDGIYQIVQKEVFEIPVLSTKNGCQTGMTECLRESIIKFIQKENRCLSFRTKWEISKTYRLWNFTWNKAMKKGEEASLPVFGLLRLYKNHVLSRILIEQNDILEIPVWKQKSYSTGMTTLRLFQNCHFDKHCEEKS